MKKIFPNFFNVIFIISLFVSLQSEIILAQPYRNSDLTPKPPQNKHSMIQKSTKDKISIRTQRLLNKEAYFFSENIKVNSDTNNVINDFAPVIAVSDNGMIYVIWNGDETVRSIYFSRSADKGATFSKPIKINDDVNYPPSYSVYQPDIALDAEGNIYVVWHDYRYWNDDQSWNSPIEIFMDKSTDGGLTWNVDVQITSGSGLYPWHFQPYIEIDKGNNNIYVTFNDYDRYASHFDNCDVSIVTSFNQGSTFASKIRVDDIQEPSVATQSFSSLSIDTLTHHIYVVFNDDRNTSKDIYLAKSTDFGSSFLSNVLVSTDTLNDQEEPNIKIDNSGTIYVIWKDWHADSTPKEAPYQNDLYISKSIDAGFSFSEASKVNDEFLNAEYDYNFPPKIAIGTNGKVHVTWFDFRYGYTNIFYDESDDGGITFSQDIIVNDNKDSLSHSLPRIAADKNNEVYIVWMDKRDGNNHYNIFFSKKVEPTNVENIPEVLSEFYLGQNYPNPFNPSTKIRWQSPVRGYQNLKVYDILGNVIATLAYELMEAGRYEVDFNASSLANGIYIYKLQIGEFISSKKMILLK